MEDYIEALGCTLGEELLKPTKIYVRSVLETLSQYEINGMVHNTGGGFIDNIPRILPRGVKAVIDKGSWAMSPIFSFLAENGNIPESEMYRTFNMGIGMMAIVDADLADPIVKSFQDLGESAFIIGETTKRKKGEEQVELI